MSGVVSGVHVNAGKQIGLIDRKPALEGWITAAFEGV